MRGPRALATRLLEAFVNSERYAAIERTDTFMAEIDREQVKQRSGAVDDAQISLLGKQSGVQFVCVADITPVFGNYQVSARIINVETAAVSAIGVADSPLETIDDLRMVSRSIVAALLGISTDESAAEHKSFADTAVQTRESDTISPPPPPPTTQQLNGIVMFSEFNVENINKANNEDLYPWLLIGFFYDGALIEGLYFYTELQYQLRLTAIENQNGNSVSLMWLSFNIELYYNLNMFYLLLKNEYNIRITPRFDLYGIKNENREGILTPGIGLNLFSELYIQIETPLTYIRFWRNEDDKKFHSNLEIVIGWWRGRYNSSGERITSTFDIKNKALQLNAHYLYSLNRFTFYIGCELNGINTKSDMMIKPFLGGFFRF